MVAQCKIKIIKLCQFVQPSEDFGLNAKWNFFATSHGKQPCDDIGGTVTRIVSKKVSKDQLPNKSFPQNLCLNIANL